MPEHRIPHPVARPSADAPTPSGPSRRAVLAAAAWSAPVLAVAVATPGAAASGSGLLTVDFAAAFVQLDYEQTFAALVVITNSTGAPIDDEQAVIQFSGFDSDAPFDFVPSLPETVDPSLPGYDPDLPPQNELFTSTGLDGDTLTVISRGGISLPVDGVLVFALYFHRPTTSPDFEAALIVGSFVIGTHTGSTGTIPVEPAPAN